MTTHPAKVDPPLESERDITQITRDGVALAPSAVVDGIRADGRSHDDAAAGDGDFDGDAGGAWGWG